LKGVVRNVSKRKKKKRRQTRWLYKEGGRGAVRPANGRVRIKVIGGLTRKTKLGGKESEDQHGRRLKRDTDHQDVWVHRGRQLVLQERRGG